jgi:hypothetical protein
LIKIFLTLFLFILNFALRADCLSLVKEATVVVKNLRNSYKKKSDVNNYFFNLIELDKANPNCKLFDYFKIKDQEVAAYRKSIYAPDKKFNLPESQCSESMIDTSNMPKNNNQTDFRWCYIWSATNLLSFNEEIPLSVYDMASQHLLTTDERSVLLKKNPKLDFSQEAGIPDDVLLNVLKNKKGVCTEKETTLVENDWTKNNEIIKEFIAPQGVFMDTVCKYDLLNLNSISNLSLNIKKAINQLTSDKKLAVFLDFVCKDRHQLKHEYDNHYFEVGVEDTTPDKVMALIDDTLVNSHQPLAIGYASDIIYKGHNYKGKPDHESTLIGRRFNKSSGQCEYLIRNSYGDDCSLVAPSLECDKGNFWVSRTLLQKNIEDIQWLTKK